MTKATKAIITITYMLDDETSTREFKHEMSASTSVIAASEAARLQLFSKHEGRKIHVVGEHMEGV